MMKLIIAGYNIDSSLIEKLNDEKATPEVLSAAYARISRSHKDVSALRKEALEEIEKARKSNQSIIFEMGHASVAEHAVFNLDLIGISRLLTEQIQRSRLASFTEKSQRYVTFEKDYLIPDELSSHPSLKDRYTQLMDELFSEYKESFEMLKKRYETSMPDLSKRDRECMAKEDARYILPLSTKTQMGITLNARSLENLLYRLSKSPLAEAEELHKLTSEKVSSISPSLIRYTKDDGFRGKVDISLLDITELEKRQVEAGPSLLLIKVDEHIDDKLLTTLLYEDLELCFGFLDTYIKSLKDEDKDRLYDSVFEGLKSWNKLPRAFESIDFEFELIMSESCWAQFKRHRTCTLLKKGFSCDKLVIPESLKERQEKWQELNLKCHSLANELPKEISHIKWYLMLNATPVMVYSKMNLRELYHFTRLRADEHAQWEIRILAKAMQEIIKAQAPKAARMLCGKSEFGQEG